jgi:hypothetical protein
MKGLVFRLVLLTFLFGIAVVPTRADEQDCFEFCIANKVLCQAGGGQWHLDCYDTYQYYIEELDLRDLGYGPCEIG